MIFSSTFAGKRYAVLGLARSGLATVEALVASGARVTAWDDREEARAALPETVEVADPLTFDLVGRGGPQSVSLADLRAAHEGFLPSLMSGELGVG